MKAKILADRIDRTDRRKRNLCVFFSLAKNENQTAINQSDETDWALLQKPCAHCACQKESC